eukprot:gb/GFBE01074895.1/.p1 GENE.gb/GFBE01074895.1/~~gb/GFBE01074895.1/.p1  ORF type:complete len:311 (+),score=95.97 gb/GFBE01074895.1/:1-933(+)
MATGPQKVIGMLDSFAKGEGAIDADVLVNILQRCSGGQLSPTEIETLTQTMAKRADGKVGIDQFAGYLFCTLEERIEEWTTDEQLSQLGATLPAGIDKLALSFVCPDQFTDEGMGYIAAGLPSSLKTLTLGFNFSWTECKITADGIKQLAAGLPKDLTSLELILRNDELSDEALSNLAEALPKNLTRVWLSFKDNSEFTDVGLCKLIEALPPSLNEVLLNFDSNTAFTNWGLIVFSDWLARSGSNITKFFFICNSNDKFTEEALTGLCAALPKNLIGLKLEFSSAGHASDLETQFEIGADKSVSFVGKPQ